jgi:hypothetical protein
VTVVKKRSASAIVALLVVSAWSAVPLAQTRPAAPSAAAAAAAPLKGYQVLQAFQGKFTLQYPAKDWFAVPGGGASLVVLTQKKQEATVTIEFQPLQLELAPAEIDDSFAQIEAEPVTQHQPTAEGLKSKVADSNGRRVVVIDFTRRGVMGTEQVRQYSLPIGKQLYRIVCVSPAALFGRYEPVFANVVNSFSVAGATPPKSE